MLREADGSVRLVHDRHEEGLFPRETWLRLLREAGFEARAQRFDRDWDPGGELEGYEQFLGIRPDR